MSSEIATRSAPIPMHSGQLVPDDFDGIQRLAKFMFSTGMVPQNERNPCTFEQTILLVAKAFEVGLSFTQVPSALMIVRNKPCVWGDAALALIIRSPECAGVLETAEGEGDKYTATCKVVRRKKLIDGTFATVETIRSFSVQDAKTAGLWDKAGPWKQYPKRMLQMRARGFALRDSNPDLLNGLAIVEEVQDYPTDTRTIESNRAAALTGTINDLATEPTPQPPQTTAAEFDPESDQEPPKPQATTEADKALFGDVGLAATRAVKQ